MEQNAWMKALVLAKRMGNLLNEVHDVSRELAEAADRSDRVSVEMLVAMRREPIDKLAAADRSLRELVEACPDPKEGQRLAQVLDGGEAVSANEQMLAEQMASNRRRLERVRELDRALNQKLAREKSVYQ